MCSTHNNDNNKTKSNKKAEVFEEILNSMAGARKVQSKTNIFKYIRENKEVFKDDGNVSKTMKNSGEV